MKNFALKNLIQITSYSLLATSFLFAIPGFSEESHGARLDHLSTDQDTSIIIRKGPEIRIDEPDYRLDSGSDEIEGDPETGQKAGRASWKQACNDWKKEMRELNKDNQLISLNCNSPTHTQESGQYTFKSTATYKMKVRIRDPHRTTH